MRLKVNKDINIFVVCHDRRYVPGNRYLKPIQVGTALAESRIPDILHDDEGDNISRKNKYLCELTAQYWAWKNVDAEYYGFFHYRRYLSFNPYFLRPNVDNRMESIQFPCIDENSIKSLNLYEDEMKRMINKYDIITTLPSDEGVSVYHQYEDSMFHHIEDLDIAIDIIKKKYPEMEEAMIENLNSKDCYFCNMFIMRRDIFFEYSEWLFDVLELHNNKKSITYTVDESRALAYLAERLFGIYYTFVKKNKKLKVFETQRSYFFNTTPEMEYYPIAEKNNIPIVMAMDENYVPIASACIQSVMEHAADSNIYDILIIQRNISKISRERVEEQIKKRGNFSVRFIDAAVYEKFYTDIKLTAHYTIETFFRLLIPEILKNYDKVIYLDGDTIVNCDIAGLYQTELDDCILGACRDIDYIAHYNIDESYLDNARDVLKLKNVYNYFQAGVLLISIPGFRKEFKTKELFDKAGERVWRFVDQDMLNSLCQGKVKFIHSKWNYLVDYCKPESRKFSIMRKAPKELYEEYLEAEQEKCIMHFCSPVRPWYDTDETLAEHFWEYARRCPFYETLLKKYLGGFENAVQPPAAPPVFSAPAPFEPIVQQVDNEGMRIRGVHDVVYVNGLMIKLINKLNKKYPLGSKKRERMKKWVRRFVK